MIQALLLFGTLPAEPAAGNPPQPSVLELHVSEKDGTPAHVDANLFGSCRGSRRILFCVRCPKGETPQPWVDTPEGPAPSVFGPADRSFIVEPGERYVYAYVGKDIQPIEGEVTIGLHDALTVRELHVDPIVRTQLLRVHLSRPNGMPVRHDMQVSVESLVTGLTLFYSEIPANESRYGDVLPVGRYRVRVETEENGPGMCGTGWFPEPAPFGDWVEIVDLTADHQVEIDALLWSGGKLRLALDLPAGMEPPERQWNERFPTRGEPKEADWLNLGIKGPGARVTLRPDPDAPAAPRERGMPEIAGTTVNFPFAPRLLSAFQFDVILPGDEQTSADWIPPGAYIARIEARDFAPVEAKVRIQVDETTELRVKLTPP